MYPELTKEKPMAHVFRPLETLQYSDLIGMVVA